MADISKIKLPDNSEYNLKDDAARKVVRQSLGSTDDTYPLLASGQSSPVSGNNYEAVYDTGIKINPNKHSMSVGDASATGINSVSVGDHTLASHENEAAFGKYNVSNEEVDFVDLGLSVKWAKYNLGASTEEGYGNYYAWGETALHEGWPSDKTSHPYNGAEYKYYDTGGYTKYNGTDELTELLPEDDAATVTLGSNWRTPTKLEFKELVENTSSEYTTINGVNGWKFTSQISGYTDKFIFLPLAGRCDDSSLNNDGSDGYYLTSNLYTDVPDFYTFVYTRHLDSSDDRVTNTSRYKGVSVRPVSANPSHTIYSIGVGSSNQDKQNAVEVLSSGNVYINGLGGYDGSTISNNTASLQSVINNKQPLGNYVTQQQLDDDVMPLIYAGL